MTSTEIASASKIMLGTTEATAMYIGSTLIWSTGGGSQYQANGLPIGWTELEYILSDTSGQYIDLNIKLYETSTPNYDLAIKFKFRGKGYDNNDLATLFGCQNQTNPYPGTFIRRRNAQVLSRYIGGTSKDTVLGTVGPEDSKIIEIPTPTAPNVNVTDFNTQNQTHSFGTSLFCAFLDSNNTPFRYTQAELFYFRLWVGGTLVRDLIPCKDTNNTVGMYDIVNHVFYTSPNGAAFIAGPTV